MKSREAHRLGERVAGLVGAGRLRQAQALLDPVLSRRIAFTPLGRIGGAIGSCPFDRLDPFMKRLAAARTQGGWVIIGCALGRHTGTEDDLAGSVARCRGYIIEGDVWYATDILGERVPGPALVLDFLFTLRLLDSWRDDGNRWVRRAVGVAVHFWAKRSRGEHRSQARAILRFMEPLFEEKEMDAAKGVGWGLKTLGRHYSDLQSDWLLKQLDRGRKPRTVVLRKAVTYLPERPRLRIQAAAVQ